jgi:hypothetical protein
VVNHYHPFLKENCANNLEPYPYESKHVKTNRCNVCGSSMNHLHFTGFTTLDSLIKCGLVKPIAIDKLEVPLQDFVFVHLSLHFSHAANPQRRQQMYSSLRSITQDVDIHLSK